MAESLPVKRQISAGGITVWLVASFWFVFSFLIPIISEIMNPKHKTAIPPNSSSLTLAKRGELK